jgi:hypothetical protein
VRNSVDKWVIGKPNREKSTSVTSLLLLTLSPPVVAKVANVQVHCHSPIEILLRMLRAKTVLALSPKHADYRIAINPRFF